MEKTRKYNFCLLNRHAVVPRAKPAAATSTAPHGCSRAALRTRVCDLTSTLSSDMPCCSRPPACTACTSAAPNPPQVAPSAVAHIHVDRIRRSWPSPVRLAPCRWTHLHSVSSSHVGFLVQVHAIPLTLQLPLYHSVPKTRSPRPFCPLPSGIVL